jgi:site-specific DNA-cytosine methylase
MVNYASIVPLIGGETIAMQKVLKQKPEYILSYEGFEANDKHLLEHYKNKVPYHLIKDDQLPNVESVDIINTVCPCAGLSSLSPSSSSESATNDWMRTSAEYILGTISPTVFWGENAPRLASKMGEPVVKDLREIGEKYGYTFSIFKTQSILHGLSQVRDRAFYFFWKGTKVPVFEYINRKHQKIEDAIRAVGRDSTDPMDILANEATPTDNPYYKYALQKLGMTHSEFQQYIDKTTNPMEWIYKNDTFAEAAKWMDKNGYEKEAAKSRRKEEKLNSGGNIMWHNIEIPKDYIGAFVGHRPTQLTHPDEDRFLTIRECLSLMGLPFDFILQGGRKNLNHICQNVPVTTAMDMAEEVVRFVEGRSDNRLVETDYLVQDNKNSTWWSQQSSVQLDAFMV